MVNFYKYLGVVIFHTTESCLVYPRSVGIVSEIGAEANFRETSDTNGRHFGPRSIRAAGTASPARRQTFLYHPVQLQAAA